MNGDGDDLEAFECICGSVHSTLALIINGLQ